ncbi:hypothetical protein [Methylophaga sp.]|uniref:hypothetical protein n=1 Tax=Methylophaga sp. TaxID=2024840 RepID=UPI00272721F0|nr:hypothetical protein [Methylophaga sp.]MDO8826963.1 hypothetical protein [Methylophaga sp.]
MTTNAYKFQAFIQLILSTAILGRSAVAFWVEHNKAATMQAFLAELDSFCEDRRKHWQHPGRYNGALGILGSCRVQ